MPVVPHIKVTFRGVFTGCPEEWSFGLHFSSNDPLGIDDSGASDVHLDQCLAAAQTYMNNARFNDRVKMTDIRAYKIKSDGLMEGNPSILLIPNASQPNGQGATHHPLQIAWCVTTVGAERGPARFGRFFLPGPSVPVDNDSRISANDTNNMLAATVQFTKDVSDAVDLSGVTTSSNLVNVSGIGTGTNQVVDHLELGRVLDTIRTRRNKLDEARVASGHIDW